LFPGGKGIIREPRLAINAAKAKGQLIVFFLSDPRDEKQRQIAELLKEDLAELDSEFVYVSCASDSPANQNLFATRFGKDHSKLPVAVVSNAVGEEISSYQGERQLNYRKMLITARLKSGKVTDQRKVAELERELRAVEVESLRVADSFLAPMLDDLKKTKIALTALRDWTKKDEERFRAALLEAIGDAGVFVDAEGKAFKVKFDDLSKTDVEYLKTILRFREVKNQEK
jgi:hypothetical protein